MAEPIDYRLVFPPPPIHRRTTFSIVSAANDTIAEATLTPRDGVLFLTNVWTQHEHRGQGLATRVITEALAHAGPQEVWLYVWGYSGQPLPDDALVTFYQKFGFERVPGVPIMMKRPAPTTPAPAPLPPALELPWISFSVEPPPRDVRVLILTNGKAAILCGEWSGGTKWLCDNCDWIDIDGTSWFPLERLLPGATRSAPASGRSGLDMPWVPRIGFEDE